ncbi:DUF2793 domain-containing protein [Sphingomonas sp. BIUV-7]|uniref:DUF2793 domain-containing protein n=1 Tax=Sphingomonas natans TaxID=3063330 RepID=A0ABT8Y640_9SPHN|nr:DUF2793 domain-containing protein [Sphingomonas sp. BIUV-7]MDO6413786.1 DUF2793 domain-containing protein [Sphingomonas sp. BIUV-7]
MSETTPRLTLPLLQEGQAQKEALHNEALLLLDGLVGGMVEAVGQTVPPTAPEQGQSWIVGAMPTGDWSGHADEIALWTAGGWRFLRPREGVALRLRTNGLRIERGATGWGSGALAASALTIGGVQLVGPRLSGIANPGGGATIDTEARAALAAVLVTLRTHGLISS